MVEICNYIDDDGDGLIDEDFMYNGDPTGEPCNGVGECGIGVVYCVDSGTAGCTTNPGGPEYDGSAEICDYLDNDCDGTTDEEFTYGGYATGEPCNGVGECGIGVVYCIDTNNADCSTNPGGPEYDGSPEVCNGLDDDCDGTNDDGGNSLCDNGQWCDGSETCGGSSGCQAGSAPNCADTVSCTVDTCNEGTDSCVHTPNNGYCDNGQWCDGTETCHVTNGCQAGTAVDCSSYNIAPIGTCFYSPDGIPFTWDFFAGFTSTCNEGTDSCNSGTLSITHTCDMTTCSAECEDDGDCSSYCDGSTYYYNGDCDSGCECDYDSQNCNSLDSWYDNGNTRWVETDQCTQKEQKEQNYRDYTCGGSGCQYSVTGTQWVDTGTTGNKPDGTTCNDGQYCTVSDQCNSGVCGGSQRSCSDGVSCTVDTCNEGTDSCVNTPNNGLCNNGQWCDGAETCNAASGCQAGTAPNCNDGVACTVDSCNEGTDTCNHAPNNGYCDNGQWCDGSETCHVTNGCQAGTPVSCTAYNLAQIASCTWNPDGLPFTWDYFPGFTSTCNEATDSCTTGTVSLTHTCSVGSCGAECDPANPCDDNSCSETFEDYCVESRLYEYDSDRVQDTTVVSDSCGNTCQSGCTCTDCSVSCEEPGISDYCVIGQCGAECSVNEDCGDRMHCTEGCGCETDGDTNGDGNVNIFDLAVIGKAFGSYEDCNDCPTGEPDCCDNWDARADVATNGINPAPGKDGKIDIGDLILVGRNYEM